MSRQRRRDIAAGRAGLFGPGAPVECAVQQALEGFEQHALLPLGHSLQGQGDGLQWIVAQQSAAYPRQAAVAEVAMLAAPGHLMGTSPVLALPPATGRRSDPNGI